VALGLSEEIRASLAELSEANLERRTVAVLPLSPTEVELDGRRLTLFSGNDYLGLSGHPDVRRAVSAAAEQWGMGPRGSALVCGFTDLHAELEARLAEHEGSESALLFPTGYAANVGALVSLGSPDTAFFSDELNHASIIDGCRLAKGAVTVFRHRDVAHLEELLTGSKASRKVIVTDAVFSMDGVLAPLPELAAVKSRHNALLVVDEAHATLVYGPNGGGVAEHFGIADAVDLRVGTLSKAFGGMGGFVASNRRMREWILNTARSYIYSTALPLPIVARALAALEAATQTPALRDALWRNVALLGELLNRELHSPIVPVWLGDEKRALEAARRLLTKDLHVIPIRPPTVPPNTSRLRISLSAAHNSKQIHLLAEELKNIPS
jgi:8-amino-7-oxononanoate synthase